jgi:cytoskeletal protein RodZ
VVGGIAIASPASVVRLAAFAADCSFEWRADDWFRVNDRVGRKPFIGFAQETESAPAEGAYGLSAS